MRQAIDISNQQIAEFKQHILDIKNQIIASHQPPTRDEVSRAAAHSGAADGGATDGGAAAAPWFWQRGGAADEGADDGGWQRGRVADGGAAAAPSLWQGGDASDGGAYYRGAAAAASSWHPW